MKNGFKNSFISLLAVMATMPCWSQATTDSEHNNQPEVEWNVTHKADGATRFEYDNGIKKYYYEVKLLGIENNGEFEPFEPPKLDLKSGRTSKQWKPYIKEVWFEKPGKHIFSLNIGQLNSFFTETQALKLIYEIDTNSVGGLAVGSHPVRMLFEEFFDQPEKESDGKSPFYPGLTIGDSNCWPPNSLPLRMAGRQEIPIGLNEQHRSQYFQSVFTVGDLTAVDLGRLPHSISFSNSESKLQLAVFQGAIDDGNTPQITVLERNKSGFWDEFFIKDWPKTGDCKQGVNTFNQAIEISGNWLALADSMDCEHPAKTGGVYVFQKQSNGWKFHSKLNARVVNLNHSEGQTIQVEGDVIYVKAHRNSIEVFRLKNNVWNKDQIISRNRLSDWYFNDFKIHKDSMVLSQVKFEDPDIFNKESAGKAWVYRYDGAKWVFETELSSKVGRGDDDFGESLAISDRYIAVSSPAMNPIKQGQALGAVHLFKQVLGQWKFDQLIRPPIEKMDMNAERGGFGYGLQLEGNNLYIQDEQLIYHSAMMEDLPEICEFSDARGAIHHYKKQGSDWQLVKTIKLQDNPGYLGGILKASDAGLYFLSNDLSEEHQSSLFLNHYNQGLVQWKHSINSQQ